MSDWLVLDWEKQCLHGLEAEVSRAQVRVRQCFDISWPEELDPTADPQAAGQWLRKQLDQLGIQAKRVMISLPRDEAVVRQLEVPDVPDGDLPGLVRLQAETKTSSIDRMVLDFLPLPRLIESPQRQVLTVAVLRDYLDVLQKIAAEAGLDVVRLGLSPIGTCELVARYETAQKLSTSVGTMVVARHGARYEISFLRDGHLLFTHSTQIAGSDPVQSSRMVLAEIRRSQGALGRLEVEVGRVWLVGLLEENRHLLEAMRTGLKADVGLIDPWKDSGVHFGIKAEASSHAPFAGPLGMLLADGGPLVDAVDFLHPRKPVVRPDRRKQWIQVGVGVAVLLLVAAYFGMRSWAKSLDQTIAERQAQSQRMEETLKRGAPTLKALNELEDWEAQAVGVVPTFEQVTNALPAGERMYLDRLEFVSTSGSSVARVKASGVARARYDIELLNDRLARDGFDVLPHEISTQSKDSGYPYRALVELGVTPPKETASPQPGKPAAATSAGGAR